MERTMVEQIRHAKNIRISIDGEELSLYADSRFNAFFGLRRDIAIAYQTYFSKKLVNNDTRQSV